MIMSSDPKKMASLIMVAKRSSAKGMKEANQANMSKMMDSLEEVESEKEASMSALEAASDEIIQSIKDSDSKGLTEALKSFVYLCSEESEVEE